MKKNQVFSALLLFVLLIAACAPANGQELAGTQWKVQSIDGINLASSASMTMNFETANRVSGFSGCNSFGGNYRANSETSTISFSEFVATLMACTSGNIMHMEAEYFVALDAAEIYELEGDTLTIFGGEHTLVFQRAE